MQTFYQILAVVSAGLIIWVLYYRIKNDKQSFSKHNTMKSFTTMGWLALILIFFICFLVMLVRQ